MRFSEAACSCMLSIVGGLAYCVNSFARRRVPFFSWTLVLQQWGKNMQKILPDVTLRSHDVKASFVKVNLPLAFHTLSLYYFLEERSHVRFETKQPSKQPMEKPCGH